MRTLALVASLAVAYAAELPVRQVVLYKNGVGYFERAGELKPGEAAELTFRQSEMNDILKSLTVRDSSGNIVTSLRYDSAEPLDQKLSGFPFETGGDTPSLSSFLNGIRGSGVQATIGAEKITGTILLARRSTASDGRAEREQLVLLLDSGEMRTLDLSAVSAVQLADASLQARLREFLRLLGQSISADKRRVTIDSAGSAAR